MKLLLPYCNPEKPALCETNVWSIFSSSDEEEALSITAESRSHPNSGGVASGAMTTTPHKRTQRRPRLWNKPSAEKGGSEERSEVDYEEEEEEEEETKDKAYEDEDFGRFRLAHLGDTCRKFTAK